MTAITRRGLLTGATAIGALAALSACTGTGAPSPAPTRSPTFTGDAVFASGSSCIGAANGQFGRWRGKALGVTATWVDDGSVVPFGQEFGDWDRSIDYAPQYAFKDRTPFTWDAVAAGTFDDRFRADLTAMTAAWGDRTGAVNYRFQHEFNGDWYPWSVTESTAAAYVAGWRRFAGIFREVTARDPRFRLVWCPNGGSQSQGVQDIRTLWPGPEHVDLIGVDYYDFFPVQSLDEWNQQVLKVDTGGGPIGIGAWQLFAAEQGMPLALPEWGNQFGDNPLFIRVMHDFLQTHRMKSAADAAGGVLYEVYFNQLDDGGSPATKGDFRLQVRGQDNRGRPRAAAEYRRLWGDWAAI